jgi:hypothetical protein
MRYRRNALIAELDSAKLDESGKIDGIDDRILPRSSVEVNEKTVSFQLNGRRSAIISRGTGIPATLGGRPASRSRSRE